MQGRELAYHILLDVEKGAYANLVIDGYLRRNPLGPLDRAFVTEVVYGTIKNQNKLDWMINFLVKRADKLETGVRVILRLSFYQIVFLDKVPPAAATNEAVKLARRFFHSGVAGLINGVLRGYLRQPEQIKWPDERQDPLTYLEVETSHPRWMVERWINRYGFDQTRNLCEFNNRPADLWVRTNTLRCSREELVALLEAQGCQVKLSQRIPEGVLILEGPPVASLEAFQQGLFTIQDESSMLVGHAVYPQPGQKVLDVCAAPGGKATHLAQLMHNEGLILGCDIHPHRLALIRENAERLGMTCITTCLQDATKIDEVEDLPGFNHVLVDAPCSGLGVLRRRPDARWRKSLEDIPALVALQAEILEAASRVLNQGGRLIYSTCTLEPEENFGVIENFLKQHSEYKPLDLTPSLHGSVLTAKAKEDLKRGHVQFLPFEDPMDGFFIAGLEKVTHG